MDSASSSFLASALIAATSRKGIFLSDASDSKTFRNGSLMRNFDDYTKKPEASLGNGIFCDDSALKESYATPNR